MTSANLFVTYLIMVPTIAFSSGLILRGQNTDRLCAKLHVLYAAIFFVVSVGAYWYCETTTLVNVSGWPVPFAINFSVSPLNTFMLMIFSSVLLAIAVFSHDDPDISSQHAVFCCGYWLLTLGVFGALFTSDLFNFYVWVEVMSISSIVLFSVGGINRATDILHYLLLNLLGALLILFAVALLYRLTGGLGYQAIADFFQQQSAPVSMPILAFLVVGISIKAGIFPFYFWLPNAYPKANTSTMMVLSSLSTKVMLVVLLKLICLWQPLHSAFFSNSFLAAACATMVFGVMGAANHFQIKNILCFHIVSQLGYILLAIALPSALAASAALFFLIHNLFVKTNLLMIAGIIEQHYPEKNIKHYGNLLKENLFLSIMFFVSAMSLAGFPPFTGFWGKFLVIQSALADHAYISSAVAIFVSLFTLYSMLKIWRYGFCETNPTIQSHTFVISRLQKTSLLLLLLIPISIAIMPGIVLNPLDGISHALRSTP